jgi:hypothetical protein
MIVGKHGNLSNINLFKNLSFLVYRQQIYIRYLYNKDNTAPCDEKTPLPSVSYKILSNFYETFRVRLS